MAPRAAHAEAEKRLPDIGHHFIERVLPREADGRLILSNLSRQQHRRRDKKSSRRIHAQRVAGDLLANETVIGQVRVERADNVVAVGPRVRAFRVHFKAVRVRIAHHIQPVLRPAFAVVRRG